MRRPLLSSARCFALLALLALLAVPLGACGDDPPADGSSGSSSDPGSSAGRTSFSSPQKTGIATYYDATGDGSCSFGASSDLDVAAFNFPEFAKSASCGSCINVSGPSGAVIIRIVDSCPGCEKNHLDLSQSAFAKIATLEAGRVPITYQSVACTVQGKLSYHFKDGSHEFWTAIQIRNHRIPIAKVEAKVGGVYTNLPRSDYNYFIDDKGIKDDPISLRITGADGQVVEDSMPGAKGHGGQAFPGAVQFK